MAKTMMTTAMMTTFYKFHVLAQVVDDNYCSSLFLFVFFFVYLLLSETQSI